ncbi:DUF952 domain-containing protein [Occultella gossypii]|uniref:DUF952 domain-containing protein n=1 Tax=Occultella gossypii TaxID=2800820 RepID=A0ABS7SFZ3_9MICO|nr:DUF952 domain-containing protein [Occultella gossypii]MBZ2199281.1 DUF952 domain-containing protein [Occultella gossypii]
MSATILHLAHAADWAAASATGQYLMSTRGATIEQVGYLHCSYPRQLAGVAEFVHAGDPEPLVVLEIDVAVLEAEGRTVRVEALDGAPEPFPHVYGGPLPVAAVVTVRDAELDAQGRFRFTD